MEIMGSKVGGAPPPLGRRHAAASGTGGCTCPDLTYYLPFKPTLQTFEIRTLASSNSERAFDNLINESAAHGGNICASKPLFTTRNTWDRYGRTLRVESPNALGEFRLVGHLTAMLLHLLSPRSPYVKCCTDVGVRA